MQRQFLSKIPCCCKPTTGTASIPRIGFTNYRRAGHSRVASLALRAIHLLPSPRRSPINHRMTWVVVGVTVYMVSVVVSIAFIVIRRGEGTPPYETRLPMRYAVKEKHRRSSAVLWHDWCVSRVLSWTVIYLECTLPCISSRQSGRSGKSLSQSALLRIEFTGLPCYHGTR